MDRKATNLKMYLETTDRVTIDGLLAAKDADDLAMSSEELMAAKLAASLAREREQEKQSTKAVN